MAQHQTLDAMFQVAPEPTPSSDASPNKTVIEIAAELLEAESPSNPSSSVPAIPSQDASSVPALPQTPQDTHNQDLQTDVDLARTSLKTVITQGESAVQSALQLAEAGEKPGAYRVVGELITATVNANKALVDIHKVKKDAEKVIAGSGSKDQSGDVNIDKAVFVGRASDFLRELKKARRDGTQ